MKKVLDYIRRYELIAKGDHVVVGVSGGADSVCLLFLLEEISKVLEFTISVVHVNHHLRGDEADRDEAFTRKLCERMQVPFEVFHYDIRQMADEGKMSIEETGRKARYEAFDLHCKNVGALLDNVNADKNAGENGEPAVYADTKVCDKIKIALAHHQNDVAETFLYHLARGTDLAGLSAIRPARGKYIRPLLCMNRQEIEHYLNARNIEYVKDSTNEEDVYTRNKIRHHVVEYLENEINPRTAVHMAETSESLGEIQDFLLELYAEKYQQYAKESHREKPYRIFLEESLFSEKKVLVKGVLRIVLGRLSGSLKNIGRIHIERVYDLSEMGVGKSVSLPYGLTAEKEYHGISIWKQENLNLEKQRSGEGKNQKKSDLVYMDVNSREGSHGLEDVPLMIPGETVFENYRIISAFEEQSLKEIPEKTYTKWFDYDKIKGNLVLRHRRKGDYLVINGLGGRKKLKDYFINEKIPQKERDQIPLVCCGDHVAWICGHRISELYKVDENSKKIIRIQISAIHRK